MSWQVIAPNGNTKTVEDRAAAEAKADELQSLFPEGDVTVERAETDGGPDVVEHVDTEAATPAEAVELPERSVGEDPIEWVPEDFVDVIDGTPAINRKGFEVLSHFYNVGVSADIQVPPEETDFEFCRVKAVATCEDGRECEAFGSAHVDRGDDPELLLEMASTRARKRALSIATGVGAVAVEELKNEVGR